MWQSSRLLKMNFIHWHEQQSWKRPGDVQQAAKGDELTRFSISSTEDRSEVFSCFCCANRRKTPAISRVGERPVLLWFSTTHPERDSRALGFSFSKGLKQTDCEVANSDTCPEQYVGEQYEEPSEGRDSPLNTCT